MDKEKVLNLAKLSRIDISGEEAATLSNEFDAILGYVGEVKNATDNRQLHPAVAGQAADNFLVKNVMREDGEPHEGGIYTEKLLVEAPDREGDYIKVKKIL